MKRAILILISILMATGLAALAQPVQRTILTTNVSNPNQFGNNGGTASFKNGGNITNLNSWGRITVKNDDTGSGISFGGAFVITNAYNTDTALHLIDTGNSAEATFINGTWTGSFVGGASGLTSLNASQLTIGTVPSARLSTFGTLTGTQLIVTGGPNYFGNSFFTNGATATNTDPTKVPFTIGANGSATNSMEYRTNGVVAGGFTNDTFFIPRIIASNLISMSITADNASAGNLGEYVESLIASGSATALTSATAKNVTSISLTAGDWDVSGNVNFSASGATVTGTSGGISSTSATVPTDGSEVFSGIQTSVVSENDSVTLPRKRFSLSSTTTVYLVAKSTFSFGSVSAFGQINARRVR